MWTWKSLPALGPGFLTHIMEVPNGTLVRTERVSQQGRGPNYAEHPHTYAVTCTFVPGPGPALPEIRDLTPDEVVK